MNRGRVIFITGTGTGVGKTTLTCLWVRQLLSRGVAARAVKPLCSGGDGDAVVLAGAQSGRWNLDEVSPWRFRAALTPLLAARRQGIEVGLSEVVRFCRSAARGNEVLLVEGAGGLRSPMGEGWDAPECIRALDAAVVVVGWNRLGTINEVRLTMAGLPRRVAAEAMLCLMTPAEPDQARRSNLDYFRSWLGEGRVVSMPHLPAGGGDGVEWSGLLRRRGVGLALSALYRKPGLR